LRSSAVERTVSAFTPNEKVLSICGVFVRFYAPDSFQQQILLKFKEETSRSTAFGALLCMVLKRARFGKWIRSTWKVLKGGTGGGWRR